MKKNVTLFITAMLLTVVTINADARGRSSGGGGKKSTSTGGGGGTPTNYGCQTYPAGTALGSTILSAPTYTCYICNTTTRVCTVQSPASLVGSTFNY